MEYTYSGKLAILNLILWLIFVIIYRAEFFRHTNRSMNYAFIGIIVTIFATFGFSEADTYHYHRIYDEMLKFSEAIHVEDFYYWLIKVLPHNYYIWRLVVWGSATILMIATFKRYNLSPSAVGLVFPLLLLLQFTITRGCLGIALFMYSSSFILKPAKFKFCSYAFGIIGCMLSFFLHRSIPLFVIMFILAFVPLNKTLIILSVILYPVLRSVVMPYVFNFIGAGFLSAETADFAQNYLEADKYVANFNGILRLCLEYLPRFLLFFFLIKEYIFNKNYIAKPIKYLFQYSYILFYVAMLFFGQSTSSFVASRTIHMMCFPLTIVVAYNMTTNLKRSFLLKSAMFFFICADLFAFLYTIYTCW